MVANPHSTVAQVLQVGVETTEGTSVAASKTLPSLDINFNPDGNFNKYRPAGAKYPTVVILGKEWTTGAVKGPITYGELPYILSSAINYAAPVTAASISTWTHTPSSTNPDTSKSYTFEWGDSTAAYKCSGVYFNEVSLKFTRESVEVTAQVVGRRLSAGITLTGSPTAVENVPVPPPSTNIYYAVDFATLTSGATQLTIEAFEAEFKISKRFAPFWPLNSSLTSFGGRVEDVPDAKLMLKLMADTSGSDFTAPATLAAMRAGSTLYFRIKSVGPTLAAGNYTLTIDMACKVDTMWKYQDLDGALLGVAWEFAIVHDATANKAYNIIELNGTTAL